MAYQAVIIQNRQKQSKNPFHYFIFVFGIIIYFALGVLTFLTDQDESLKVLDALPIICPLRRFTGFLCVFCGMTHAWIFFWHGNFRLALGLNVLSVPLFFGFPIFAFTLFFTEFWNQEKIKIALKLTLAALLTFAFGRNLSFF